MIFCSYFQNTCVSRGIIVMYTSEFGGAMRFVKIWRTRLETATCESGLGKWRSRIERPKTGDIVFARGISERETKAKAAV